MADKIAIMLELEKRGALPSDKLELLNEARSRGLVQGSQKTISSPKTAEPNAPEWATTGGVFGEYGPTVYGVQGAAKEVARFGAETAGLVGGGIAGTFGLGPGAGTLIGAGLGYSGVKQAERFFEDKPIGIKEHINTAGKDFLIGSAMDAGGQLIGKAAKTVIEKIKRPTRADISQSEIEERMALAAKQGITLTPAEATGSKGLALYESMLDKSPFSTSIINEVREIKQLKPLITLREKLISDGGKAEQVEVLGQKIQDEVNKFLAQYKSINEGQLNNLRDNVLKKIGSTESFDTLGKKAQEAIATRSKSVYDTAGELYSGVGTMIPEGTSIRPENMRTIAEQLLASESKKPVSLQNPTIQKMLRDLSGANDELMQEISAYPEAARNQIIAKMKAEGQGGFDWKTIQSIRSELNSRIAQSDAAIKTSQPNAKFQSSPEAGIYKQLRKALDTDIQEFATAQGGEVKGAFDLANAFYKEGKLTYNSPVIRRLINTNPEKVVDAVFRPKGGFEIDAIRKSIGNEVFNKTMKPAITKRLLGEGTFSPQELSSKLKSYGDEVLSKVYNANEIKMIKELAEDGKIQMETTLIGHPFLKTLAKERPDVVVDSILGSADKLPGIKMVLKNTALIRTVVPKDTFLSLQREMSDRIFKLNQLTGQVQPEKLSKTIQTYDRVLKLFYPPEQVQWLRDISKTTKLMASAEKQAANPSGTAQNVITWGTWGAIINNPIKGIFTGIFTPQVMARFYLSPQGRKLFTNALQTPANSGEGAALFTKIMEIAGTEQIEKGKQP